MGKTYIGRRTGDRIIVLVRDESGQAKGLNPKASQAVYNHSPDGFNWGYGGSGPAQLALAILLDHVGNQPLAERLYRETAPSTAQRFYQMFKTDFVSTWGDQWELRSEDIEGWLRMQYNNAAAKKKDYSHGPTFPMDNQGGGTIING